MKIIYNELLKRFLNKVLKTDSCWIWLGATNYGKNGNKKYGRFSDGNRMVMAHRFAYETFKKKIKDGMTIDHKCNVPFCVNPSHLQEATLKDNILRGNSPSALNARKKACYRGHEFVFKQNHNRGRGARVCPTCLNIWFSRNRPKRGEK